MYSIALLTGGVSTEKEVSLKSAAFIQSQLEIAGYTATTYNVPEDFNRFLAEHHEFDLLFPVIHGIGGEDGALSSLAEQLGMKYFFTSPETHMLAINKYVMYQFLISFGFAVPKTRIIQNIQDITAVNHPGAIFVKPSHGGSSIDSGKFNTIQEAQELITHILTYDTALVQEYLKGREFTVSIVGDRNHTPEIYAISEIITTKDFFDYAAKYTLDQTQEITPANMASPLQKELEKIALDVYKRGQFTCLARIDFIYINEKFYVLEVNTIPGFTQTSFFPQAITHHGLSVSEFFKQRIQALT